MNDPESVYISREEVLRNLKKSGFASQGAPPPKGPPARIHDSWSSRASSILAKAHQDEPTYVSR